AEAPMRRFTREAAHVFTGLSSAKPLEPIATLALGETVVIETVNPRNVTLGPGVIPELAEPRGAVGNPLTGPFLIEGVEPGDWIAAHIVAIEPEAYAYVNNGGPFRGVRRSVVALRDGMIHFPPDFRIPIRPMVGVIGVAPVQACHDPWDHGGNI